MQTKHFSWIFIISVACAGILTACGPGGKADTSKLEKGFQSAAAGVKSDINQIAANIKSGDYAKAVPVLQKVIKAGGLTDEQKEGIASAITGMQTVASQNPNRYSVEVYQSLSDLIDLMEGREPLMKPGPARK